MVPQASVLFLSIPKFALLLGAVLVASAAPAAGWEKVTTTSDGIFVEIRAVKGMPVVEVRGSTETKIKAERLWRVIADLEHYIDFMPYLSAAKLLKRSGPVAWQYYCVDAPIISDRDYTLKLTQAPNLGKNGIWKVSWQTDNAAGPAPKPGKVRVKIASGSWIVTALRGGAASRLSYVVKTDPGGSIPSWIANKANRRAVPDVMRAVLKQSRKSRYSK